MFWTKRSVGSRTKSRSRAERTRHNARWRRLRAEPLEPRFLLSADSWVASTVFPAQVGIQSIATDTEGGVYVAFNGPSSAETDYDIWLKKYDKFGDEQWTRGYQIPDSQIVQDIAVGQDGVFIVGSFSGTMNLDSEGSPEAQLVSRGESDGFLAKLSVDNGELFWAKQWGGTVGDGMDSVTVAGESVFVLGGIATPINKHRELYETLIGRYEQDTGEVEWEQTFDSSVRGEIAVFAPASEPARIYVGGGNSVAKLTEPVDAASTFDWILELGNTPYTREIAVGTDVVDGMDVPSLYMTRQTTTLAGEIIKISDAGEILWSTSMTSDIDILALGVAVDAGTAYVTGRFNQQALFNSADPASSLTSSGDRDGFLARYDTTNGHLTAVQRMGGSASDYGYDVAVGNNRVYMVGGCRSTDADYPASLPGQMSAFVPATSLPGDIFVVQLDTLAPIVKVADTDVSVAENTPVTLTATTSAGTITWYESNGLIATGDSVELTLGAGIHQISAIATDNDGRIGMAGVVVTVIGAPVNNAPVAVEDQYTAYVDTALNVPVASGVLANDSDADQDVLTALLDVGPTHGSITLNGDGSFSYTPIAGYVGGDSFTYLVQDGRGGADTGTVSIAIVESLPATLSINDVSKDEGKRGTTIFTFIVTRSGDTAGSVSVNYATADGTALAGSDYYATSGTLTFAPGVTSQTINVSVIGDRTAEDTETFFVNLSNVVGGTIVDAQGLGTIQNDDGTPLMAAFAEQSAAAELTIAQVEQLTPMALAVWSGQSSANIPSDLRVELDDLPSGQLGEAFRHTITLDRNGNGAGWYTDLAAPAAGRVDLLTVLAHEIGHVLGYDHSDVTDDLMAATLPAGMRRLPAGTSSLMTSLPTAARLDSRWSLPNARLGVLQSDLFDSLDAWGDVEADSRLETDQWLLPWLTTDLRDQPHTSSDADQIRVFHEIADEETALLDDELLDLITAGPG